MKRIWAAALLTLGFVCTANAQFGMDAFKRPAFTKVFHPVVGQGAQYEMTNTGRGNNQTTKMDMGIVGKESVDGKDGYWFQMVMQMQNGQTTVAKTLMTTTDFQPSRMIVQMAGSPAMEMPMSMATAANREKATASMQDWHSVGNETITVPAGTFTCEHWKNDNGGEVWTSEKVTPFGMVKEIGTDHSMVLVKVLSDFSDKITGPVQKFDPQLMMQQRMQQRQQPQQ
jgi:hypothetical protein